MSADLTLIALPATDEWRAAWAEFQTAELIVDDLDAEDEARYREHGIVWMTQVRYRALLDAIFQHPNIEVGQVSGLKAGLMGDFDRYVPAPIQRVANILGDDGKVLTAGLAKELTVAFNLPNRSIYGHVAYERVTEPDEIAWRRQDEVKRRRGERRWAGRFIEPNIVQHGKGRGLIGRQHLKAWLAQRHGSLIVAMTV